MNDPRAFARAVAEELFSMFAQALATTKPPVNDVAVAPLDLAQRRQEAKAAVRAMRQNKTKG